MRARVRTFRWLCGVTATLACCHIGLHAAFIFRSSPASTIGIADNLLWWTLAGLSATLTIWSWVLYRSALPWRVGPFTMALAVCAPAISSSYESWTLDRALTRASASHLDRPDLKAVQAMLRWATDHGVRAKPAVMGSLGKRLLETASGTSPKTGQAWNDLIELMNYKSAILPAAQSDGPSRSDGTAHPHPGFATSFARLGSIQVETTVHPDGLRVVTRPRGPGLLLLDGRNLEHVRFRGVPVGYLGGELRLSDTGFEQCTFYVQQSGSGFRLMRALLNSPQS